MFWELFDLFNRVFGILWWIGLVIIIGILFGQRKSPESTLIWATLILVLPGIGILLYLLIGVDLSKTRMFRQKDKDEKAFYQRAIKRTEKINSGEYIYNDLESYKYEPLIKTVINNGYTEYTEKNSVDLFFEGNDLLEALLEDINNAKHSIFIQSYIISSGYHLDKVSEALIKKAKEGLDVRILVDGLGGRKFKKKDRERLIENGIKIAVFFPPFLKYFTLRINFRNHRKIYIIDNKIGYVGGFNIGDEYLNRDPEKGFWRDTHARIVGESINDLINRFYLDYKFATGDSAGAYQTYVEELDDNQNVAVSIVSSGPESELEQIRDGFQKMINLAKHRIYIQTPYFVPDDGLMKSLIMACYSGVDVRIMVPKKPDHPFVVSASRSYLGQLLEHGAKVYYYKNEGFLHSKMILVDDYITTVGTTNFDVRSFGLNFEVNAFIFDFEVNHENARQFDEDILNCEKYTFIDYKNRPTIKRISESISRLLSPLL